MNDIYDTFVQNSTNFGVICSSFSTCETEVTSGQSSLDSISAILEPFTSESFPDGGQAPLSLCLSCGAYPHCRNDRIQPLSIGCWRCVFCGFQNTDGLSNPPPQIEGSHPIEAVEYSERIPCFESVNCNEDRILHIFSIDSTLLRDRSAHIIIRNSLSHIPSGSKLALIVVDEHVRVIRLGQHTLTPLMMDVIPTTGSNESKYLKTLIQSSQYVCRSEFVISNFDGIFESLHASFSPNKLCLKSPLFCLNTVVSVCAQIRNSIGLTWLSAKCIMLMGREFRCNEHSIESRYVKCSRYSNLGKRAYNNRCSFYALQLGISALNVSGIDAFTTASGGLVVTAETVEESSFVEVIRQIFSKASALVLPIDLATVEFRCTPSIGIDRVTGPVVSVSDVAEQGKCQDKNFFEESLYLNEKHFTAALQSVGNVPDHTNTAISDKADSKKNYRKLADAIKRKIACCGLIPREDVETAIAFQVKRLSAPIKKMQHSKSNSLWTRFKSYPASLLHIGSSHSTREVESHCVSNNDDAFVQVIARFSYIAIDNLRRLEKVFVTRVWTIKINHETCKLSAIRNLNIPIWSFGVMRTIIADYHDEIESTFDGPRPHRSLDTDYTKHSSIKRKFVQQFDYWYKELSAEWRIVAVNAIQAARYFYHCLEGPLLDGPCASCQEAYCLRSAFLRSAFKLAHNILLPSLRLDLNYFRSGNRNKEFISLLSMPPDSTSLLPMTFGILDLGDHIIVRRNICTTEEDCDFALKEANQALVSFAKEAMKSRFPACRLTILDQPGGPLDRILLCRLSPSHLDSHENVVRRLQSIDRFASISLADIKIVCERMPVTDQLNFQQFLALKSRFLNEEFSRTQMVKGGGILLTTLNPPPLSQPYSSKISASDRGINLESCEVHTGNLV